LSTSFLIITIIALTILLLIAIFITLNSKNKKILSINGAILTTDELEKHALALATDHTVTYKSSLKTYPKDRLKENFKFITIVYNVLNSHVSMGIDIHPAGEWLLDNYYIIEETVYEISKQLSKDNYKKLPGLKNGSFAGFARIYELASEITSYTDSKIEEDNIIRFLSKYQSKKNLNMEEIWIFPIFLKIAVIENIRNICEKIYSTQMQKYKVENIIERIIENKNNQNLKFKMQKVKYHAIDDMEIKTSFIEHMSYKLKKMGRFGIPYTQILEEQIEKLGLTTYDVIKKEHYDLALRKVSMGNSITSIKNISRINFIDIFEKTNGVEEILLKDPSNVYSKMDYKTKSKYREKIKKIAQKIRISEIYVATKVLECAQNATEELKDSSNNVRDLKKTHIGYYLIDKGIDELKEKLEYRVTVKDSFVNSLKKDTATLYIEGYLCLTLILVLILEYITFKYTNNIILSIIIGIIGLVPLSEIVTQIFQYIFGKILKPNYIPKLDYMNGIPEESSTFVIVPTILKEKEKVVEQIKNLEEFYLGNRTKNLYFALLGDASEEKTKDMDFDKEIIDTGLQEIEKLNQKYFYDTENEFPIFHFLYRERQFNKSQKSYLGWERKRGLILEFNKFLLNKTKGTFLVNTIQNQSFIPKIKYIITLDADTELVLNSGLEVVRCNESYIKYARTF